MSEEIFLTTNKDSQKEALYKQLALKRKLFLIGEVEPEMATNLSANLLLLDAMNNEEITIYINSQGGDVDGGLFTIYNTMQILNSPIKTICIGEAMSSAAVILTAGTKGLRFAYPNSQIMIHSVSAAFAGTTLEIEMHYKSLKAANNELMGIIAKHSGQTLKKVKKDCKVLDKYFSAQEAVEYGLIDAIFSSKQH